MKKQLLSVLFSAFFVAPIASKAENLIYSPCEIEGNWYGCNVQRTGSTPSTRSYLFRTIGEEYSLSINCIDIKYPNQRTSGTMMNLYSRESIPINCVFNVSTQSQRSITIYSQGTWEPIFTLPTTHNIGRKNHEIY